MDLNEMLKSMGIDLNNINQNQKDVIQKANEKINQKSEKEKATDWVKEKYNGLFPIWK